MTNDIAVYMTPDESRDTAEIVRLKHDFWTIENLSRPYPHLREHTEPLQANICAIVAVLAEYAKEHNQPPTNVTNPRAALPADSDGRLSNGKILAANLAAHSDPSARSHEKATRWMHSR